jgi:hypothetical protein
MDWRNRKAEKSGDIAPASIMQEVLERFAPISALVYRKTRMRRKSLTAFDPI